MSRYDGELVLVVGSRKMLVWDGQNFKELVFMEVVLHAKNLIVVAGFVPALAWAADLDGGRLSVWWAIPFAGLLLSIALCPLLVSDFWHRHFGKVSAAWTCAFLVPCAVFFGVDATVNAALHAFVAEYMPFIVLLAALFVVAGGICVRGNLHGTPALNTGLLALGALLASFVGTTGASMLMIRPVIRANDNRKHATHIFVFFIFLVANAGGALTPLGDPPLFLGFLKGIDFFWTLKNIFPETLFLCGMLLVIFYFLDCHYYHNREEELSSVLDPTPDSSIRFEGGINFLLLAVIIGLVLMSGLWRSGEVLSIADVHIDLQSVVRDILLVVVVLVSLWITPQSVRIGNGFSWVPVQEVAKLFAGIFLTIIPVVAMLRAGESGVFASIIHAVTDSSGRPIDVMYFWATGILSSFLDNAPTYLVFFNAAGGDPHLLMTPLHATLAAISCGAVFMGANSYIGNAPNLMIKAIVEERGIRMPSFFGYMGWACAILAPLFILMTFIFFH